MDQATQRLLNYVQESEIALVALKRIHSSNIESIDVQNALVEVLDLQFEGKLLGQDLDSDQIIGLLEDFNFKKYHPHILGTIDLDSSIIPAGIPKLLTEKRIKHKNEIWEIHKYDDDPFPSDPHAHNYESKLKLDLSNGKLYRKRNQVGGIKEKTLKQIRAKAGNIDLPELSI